MRAVSQAAQWLRDRNPLVSKAPPEPEPVYGPTSRPMSGLFASLKPEQRALILSYKGEENHGDSNLRFPAKT